VGERNLRGVFRGRRGGGDLRSSCCQKRHNPFSKECVGFPISSPVWLPMAVAAEVCRLPGSSRTCSGVSLPPSVLTFGRLAVASAWSRRALVGQRSIPLPAWPSRLPTRTGSSHRRGAGNRAVRPWVLAARKGSCRGASLGLPWGLGGGRAGCGKGASPRGPGGPALGGRPPLAVAAVAFVLADSGPAAIPRRLAGAVVGRVAGRLRRPPGAARFPPLGRPPASGPRNPGRSPTDELVLAEPWEPLAWHSCRSAWQFRGGGLVPGLCGGPGGGPAFRCCPGSIGVAEAADGPGPRRRRGPVPQLLAVARRARLPAHQFFFLAAVCRSACGSGASNRRCGRVPLSA